MSLSRRAALGLVALFVVSVASGCMTTGRSVHYGPSEHYDIETATARAPRAAILSTDSQSMIVSALAQKRVLIREASVTIAVDDVKETVKKATTIAEETGGFIENSSAGGENYASLRIKVPTDKLDLTLDKLAGLGNEISRYQHSADVTEVVIDLEAKLKNDKALRDRLRKLLERAESVKDVILVEEQLTRLQAQIDSMETRLKHLKGKAKLAVIDLQIERKRILGPLGYVGKGLVWVITKLFVIR